MSFEVGNPYGGAREGAGRKPIDEAVREGRRKFYRLMTKEMLPLAAGFLLECLRSQRKDDKKWATTLVTKKSLPDGMVVGVQGIDGGGSANTLAGLIQQAAQATRDGAIDVENMTEKEKIKDIGKSKKIIVVPLTRRPGASESMKKVWAERKKKGKKNS